MTRSDRVRFWQAPFLAFGSPRAYRSAAFDWRGLGLGYLLLLVALAWVPVAISVRPFFDALETDLVARIAPRLPALTLEGGRLVAVDAPTPFDLELDGERALRIDPDARIGVGGEAAAGLEPGLNLAGDGIAVVGPNGTSRQPYPPLDVVIDGDDVRSWAGTLRRVVAPLIVPVGALASFVGRVVMALAFGLLAWALARGRGRALPYAAAVRIAALAVGVVIVLQTAFGLAGLAVPYGWLVFAIVAAVYVTFGVSSLDGESEGGRAA